MGRRFESKIYPPPAALAAFRARVWAHYRAHGRHALPWRKTHDPYRILVSEIMLQQTQVERVIPFYKEFIKRFPTARALARAPLADVLRVWQGLGYNRRAKFLHAAAQAVVARHGGRIPNDIHTLASLPGIGPYTAAAVATFAFDTQAPCVETNIRTALIHDFFPEHRAVADSELLALLARLPSTHPREWLYALMDYGTTLKRRGVKNNAQSKSYMRQKAFRGSDREIRGAILRVLAQKSASKRTLVAACGGNSRRISVQLAALKREGLISEKRGRFLLG